MNDLYVKIRTKRAGDSVFEHICERNPNPENMDERPRVLWLTPTGARGSLYTRGRPTWVIEQGYKSRFEIFACPWCYVHLPSPDEKECLCGADLVRESRGTHVFETVHDFDLHDGTTRRARVRAIVQEFVHEPDCPALRQKEIEG